MVEALWVEKYRPHTIADCILPEEYKSTFQSYVDRKEIPHLLLCGGPGTGKTTVARALCDEIGCDYLMINGSDESGIDTFRTKIKHYASAMSLGGGKKVIIIDEPIKYATSHACCDGRVCA
jgi:DNA polymerase III delta prime subunit